MDSLEGLLDAEQAGVQAVLLRPAVDEGAALFEVALVDARVGEQVGASEVPASGIEVRPLMCKFRSVHCLRQVKPSQPEP